MSDTEPDTRVVKLAGALAAVAASALAQKLISATWRAARGHTPPTEEDAEAGVGLAEVLVAAALTGAVVAVVRVLASRGAVRAARQAVARSAADDSL
ncbi:MAG: DUF4235 domain-containing protein [Micrococcales bacterium]|nr:DUF4235 domain-containing protein [Micrococcales bacterium]